MIRESVAQTSTHSQWLTLDLFFHGVRTTPCSLASALPRRTARASRLRANPDALSRWVRSSSSTLLAGTTTASSWPTRSKSFFGVRISNVSLALTPRATAKYLCPNFLSSRNTWTPRWRRFLPRSMRVQTIQCWCQARANTSTFRTKIADNLCHL